MKKRTKSEEHNEEILSIITAIADEQFDGHFTIMKFTTNWRVSFGPQPTEYMDIQENMGCGATLGIATQEAIRLGRER
jgi:hypothetical protein